MKRNPIDEALAEIMDAWMDMMNMPISNVMNHNERYFRDAGIEVPLHSKKQDIGDWEDKNGEITLTIDMPGIQKKDIELNVDKHGVSVKAETVDRDYSFNKMFETVLNPDKVTAKFNNGVLDIKIQKAEEDKGKKITIK